MRKYILTLLLFTISYEVVLAEEKIAETEKLVATAKVWGFLKYYHPKVAAGKFDWDKQLFEVLPKIKGAKDKTELSQIFIDWIDGLGKIRKCKKCGKENELEYFDKNFDLSWLEDSKFFTAELTEKLKYIEENRHQGEKHYVKPFKKVGQIQVINEIDYKDFDWQDENLRLLSLFRYWNIIEYFFPYKYQTDTKWDEVLYNMLPKFLKPETETALHLTMLELIICVDDSHAGFFSDKIKDYFGNYWIPATYKLIDEKAVITRFYNDSLARANDIKIGDVITKINGKDVWAIFKEKEKYIIGSNTSRKKFMAFNAIFNGATDSVQIEYVRNRQSYSKTVKRYLFEDFNIIKREQETFKILDGNIGYVNMGVLKVKDVPDVMEALNDTDAIVLDNRSYPKGTMYSLILHISSKRNKFFKVTKPDIDYPGKFVWRAGIQCGRDQELKYKGKVVLLVNERTQSHAEFTAMCLQTGDNVTTIGSQTSGADGNVSRINMVGGYKTAISGIGIFYPDGTETQRVGVKIDIEVKPTIQGIREGRDEVLEKAIDYVSKQK